MTNKIEIHKTKVPTIQDLHDNTDLAIKKDTFMVIINQDPPESWVKRNKYAGNSKYIPIEKVEWMLRRFFKNPKFEILNQGVMFNSCYTTARIHYLNPATNEWEYQDGTGASQIQVKAGSSPSEMQNIGQGAIEKALPDSYSAAIKNAAKKIGKVFGSDLNRDSPLPYTADEKLMDVRKSKEEDRLRKLISSSKTLDDLAKHYDHIDQTNEQLINFYNEKAKQIRG